MIRTRFSTLRLIPNTLDALSGAAVPSLLAAAVLSLAGCGGGNPGETFDAGACPTRPMAVAWPSESDPQVCSRDVLATPEAVRTQCGDITLYCATDGVAAPSLACLTDAITPPTNPTTATLTGFADVFSSGPSSNGVRIQIFRASDIGDTVTDLSQVTPIAQTDVVLDTESVKSARACPIDRHMPEALAGECVVPTGDCTSGCDVAVNAVDFCYETSCYGLQRWEARYAIADLPTNQFLVIRSIGLTGGIPDPASETWAPLVQYNVYLSTAERACTGADDNNCFEAAPTPMFHHNVNLLSRSDYQTIPVTGGLSSGVTPGHGIIAGEVHDCSDVRIEHAQIGYSPLPLRNTYFNGNPIKTLPEINRGPLGTEADSLYAGFDIPPGPIQIVALGNIGGTTTLLGQFTARIWADSVTLVTINGGRPPQP